MFGFTFDEEAVLRQLGLESSSEGVKAQVVDGIYRSLDANTRVRLGNMMTSEDFITFGELAEKNDDEAAKFWLRQRFPDYEEICEQELEALVVGLKRRADAAADAVGND